ncbi:hypothetical protein HYALB_00010073 [Hymenoscyphus albidus]|uniref:Short-chain dehydrogenase n=1 Tax=Hymenoscyphus albidus TaxID=595503 RepID=A0A9N9LNP7_9HELO|nr:hypothetical protein HYALB_00010073 [Hymenoscyphus albidus]
MTSHSEFGKKTEAEEVISEFKHEITGKASISPNGLGATLAHSLSSQTPHLLILSGRSLTKIQAVAADLQTSFPLSKTHILPFDLSNLSSVRAAASILLASPGNLHIDILINNAGVMNIPVRTLSPEGFEMHLATNYLGLFLFTNTIISKLGKRTRIVNVASDGYRFSPFRFGDWNFSGGTMPEDEWPPKELRERFGFPWGVGYIATVTYAPSNSAVVVYSGGLVRRGVGCDTVAVKTELWRHVPEENKERIFGMMGMKSLSQGVSTILVAALDPMLKGMFVPFLLFEVDLTVDSDNVTGTSSVYLEDCQVTSIPASTRILKLAKGFGS